MEKEHLQMLLQVTTVLCNGARRWKEKDFLKVKQRKWGGKCDHCQRQCVLAGLTMLTAGSEGMCIIICQWGELSRACEAFNESPPIWRCVCMRGNGRGCAGKEVCVDDWPKWEVVQDRESLLGVFIAAAWGQMTQSYIWGQEKGHCD